MMPPYGQFSDSEDESSPTATSSSVDKSFTRKLKCVLVGDGAVGKTSLIVSYTTNGYPQEYVPTAFDNYSVLVRVDNTAISLHLCDTAGQDDFDSLRPLCYPQTDVFLLCFSVVNPTSFQKAKNHWLPEINRQSSRKVPIVLVGTQSDLRTNIQVLLQLKRYGEKPVSEEEANSLAKSIGAVSYIESSALTQQNLKEVFDAAILAGLRLNNRDSLISVVKTKKSFRRTIKDKLIVLTRSESSRKSGSKAALNDQFQSYRASMPEHSKHQCGVNGASKFGKLSQSRSCPPSINNAGGLGKSSNIFTISASQTQNGSRLAHPQDSSPKFRSTEANRVVIKPPAVIGSRPAQSARLTGWSRLLCIVRG